MTRLKVSGNQEDKLGAKLDQYEMAQERATQLVLLNVADLNLKQDNSRVFGFDHHALVALLKKSYGEDYSPFDLPDDASEIPGIETVITNPDLPLEKTLDQISKLLNFARHVATPNKLSKIGPINVVERRDGRLEVQSGNRRYIAHLIARKKMIESTKVQRLSDYNESQILSENLLENTGQDALTFSEKFLAYRRVRLAFAKELGRDPASIKRSEFISKFNYRLAEVKAIYPHLIDEQIALICMKGLFKARAELENYLALEEFEKHLWLEEHDVEILSGDEVVQTPVETEEKKTGRVRKSSVVKFPSTKDPVLAFQIVKTILNTEGYKHLKDSVLNGKRIPKSTHELAEVMEKISKELSQ